MIDKEIHKRIWEKIEQRGPNECWLWTGAKSRSGRTNNYYGEFKVYYSKKHRKWYRAHRLVYEDVNGPIPSGMCVRHTCNNTLCCNPKHLIIGTHQDNMNDMILDQRSLVGSKNPSAKLSEQDVEEIKTLRTHGNTLKYIASIYGVHLSTIGYICQNKLWNGGKKKELNAKIKRYPRPIKRYPRPKTQ